MSKGSKRRPMSISSEEFDKNWNNIFGGILWFHQCGEKIISTERGKKCYKCGIAEGEANGTSK